jgi:cytochrome c oxidase subunit II
VKTTEGKHGILIPGFGVNKPLNPGEDVDIEFLADKKGTFPMICSVFCGHGHSDMKGSLIVE